MNNTKAERVIRDLGYSFAEFRLGDFVLHVARIRHRPIRTYAVPFSPGLSGAWVPGETMDFLFYRSDTHPIHQAHIVLHELAHMLLGHPLRVISVPPVIDYLQQDAPIRGHLRTLASGVLKDDLEREAEWFVELIQKEVGRASRLNYLTMDGTSIEALRPFVEGLPFGESKLSK